jgi:hypothetical protein
MRTYFSGMSIIDELFGVLRERLEELKVAKKSGASEDTLQELRANAGSAAQSIIEHLSRGRSKPLDL